MGRGWWGCGVCWQIVGEMVAVMTLIAYCGGSLALV